MRKRSNYIVFFKVTIEVTGVGAAGGFFKMKEKRDKRMEITCRNRHQRYAD